MTAQNGGLYELGRRQSITLCVRHARWFCPVNDAGGKHPKGIAANNGDGLAEHIAFATYRSNVEWLLRVVAQALTQATNQQIDGSIELLDTACLSQVE